MVQVREKLEHHVQAPVMRKNGKQKGTMALHLKFAPKGGKVGSSRGGWGLAGRWCRRWACMTEALCTTVQRVAMPGTARRQHAGALACCIMAGARQGCGAPA